MSYPCEKDSFLSTLFKFWLTVFAWEVCWLSTKVGQKQEGRRWERSVPVCLMSSWCQLLQHQSCVTTPSRLPHTRTRSQTTIRCVVEICKKKKKRGMTQSLRCFPISCQIFHFFTLQFIFFIYVSACAFVWVAATCMQINAEARKGVRSLWKYSYMATRVMGPE